MINPADFNYVLPRDLIAQKPLIRRDRSRLLLVDRSSGHMSHAHFSDLESKLVPGDVLVLNQTKVFPARLMGEKVSGGLFQLLLIKHQAQDLWSCISRPRLKKGHQIKFAANLTGLVVGSDPVSGLVDIKFNLSGPDFWQALDIIGQTPIPPYVTSKITETLLRHRYQTVYAKTTGSAAAPTAGLHFTSALLRRLKAKGVFIEYVTLHVGLGTFQPLRAHHLASDSLHSESYLISPQVAARLNKAKLNGQRIIAVGTTSCRALESAAYTDNTGCRIQPGERDTTLFIHPPYRFRFVDSLITNFHLPQTSLLMLVAALTSAPNTSTPFTTFPKSLIGQAYKTAVSCHYRFFSFGDAMWLF